MAFSEVTASDYTSLPQLEVSPADSIIAEFSDEAQELMIGSEKS